MNAQLNIGVNLLWPTWPGGLSSVTACVPPRGTPSSTCAGITLGLEEVDGTPSRAAAGKMVRPALCLAMCEALGGDEDACRPAALAVELAHRTSFVFGDIQDHSPQRYHRDTVWAVWGVEQALNTGLALSCYGRLAIQRMLEALVATQGGDPIGVKVRSAAYLAHRHVSVCHKRATLRESLIEASYLNAYGGDPLLHMRRYHLGLEEADVAPSQAAAGKMVRPALCLAMCETLGGEPDGCPAVRPAVRRSACYSVRGAYPPHVSRLRRHSRP